MKPALLLPLILLAGCASTPPRPDTSNQLEAIPVLGPSLTVKTASDDGEHSLLEDIPVLGPSLTVKTASADRERSLLEDIPVLGHHFQPPPRGE